MSSTSRRKSEFRTMPVTTLRPLNSKAVLGKHPRPTPAIQRAIFRKGQPFQDLAVRQGYYPLWLPTTRAGHPESLQGDFVVPARGVMMASSADRTRAPVTTASNHAPASAPQRVSYERPAPTSPPPTAPPSPPLRNARPSPPASPAGLTHGARRFPPSSVLRVPPHRDQRTSSQVADGPTFRLPHRSKFRPT